MLELVLGIYRAEYGNCGPSAVGISFRRRCCLAERTIRRMGLNFGFLSSDSECWQDGWRLYFFDLSVTCLQGTICTAAADRTIEARPYLRFAVRNLCLLHLSHHAAFVNYLVKGEAALALHWTPYQPQRQ